MVGRAKDRLADEKIIRALKAEAALESTYSRAMRLARGKDVLPMAKRSGTVGSTVGLVGRVKGSDGSYYSPAGRAGPRLLLHLSGGRPLPRHVQARDCPCARLAWGRTRRGGPRRRSAACMRFRTLPRRRQTTIACKRRGRGRAAHERGHERPFSAGPRGSALTRPRPPARSAPPAASSRAWSPPSAFRAAALARRTSCSSSPSRAVRPPTWSRASPRLPRPATRGPRSPTGRGSRSSTCPRPLTRPPGGLPAWSRRSWSRRWPLDLRPAPSTPCARRPPARVLAPPDADAIRVLDVLQGQGVEVELSDGFFNVPRQPSGLRRHAPARLHRHGGRGRRP